MRPVDASDCVDFVKLRICGERNLKVVADIGTLCCGFVVVFVYVVLRVKEVLKMFIKMQIE